MLTLLTKGFNSLKKLPFPMILLVIKYTLTHVLLLFTLSIALTVSTTAVPAIPFSSCHVYAGLRFVHINLSLLLHYIMELNGFINNSKSWRTNL